MRIKDVKTFPGRVRTYINNPEQGTFPHSCSLWVYKPTADWAGLGQLLEEAALSLKGGAGVKVILDDYVQLEKIPEYKVIPPQIITVQDSMVYEHGLPGQVSIIESWKTLLSYNLCGIPVEFDLSNLRPKGTKSATTGLTASGGEIFHTVYDKITEHQKNPTTRTLLSLLGTLNDVMRRGGFKRGIITTSMDVYNPHIAEYLDIDITEIEGSHKKCVVFGEELRTPEFAEIKRKILTDTATFWGKRLPEGLFWNVCMGLAIRDGGTCLIYRLNYGQIRQLRDIKKYLAEQTVELLDLHFGWERPDAYLEAYEDNQIGLDVMGLANLLNIQDITYAEFVKEVYAYLDGKQIEENVHELVDCIAEGYAESVRVADEWCDSRNLPRMHALHTVEPAQSHSFETEDIYGFTTCRGIWPPYGRRVRRLSDTNDNISVSHGGVETTGEVGPKGMRDINEAYYALMKRFGRPHSISMDLIELPTEETIDWFLDSDIQTKYYTVYEEGTQQQMYLQKKAQSLVCNETRCSICEE